VIKGESQYQLSDEEKEAIKKQKKIMAENEEKIAIRPPVVVVLGHIDHGKTSLLMAIRDFHVLEKKQEELLSMSGLMK